MGGFAHRPGDPVGESMAILATRLDHEYDEVAAKRVEHELVELGAHLGQAQSSLSLLAGALSESPCADLIERIEQRETENQADLSRLACEARKQVRGE